VGEFDSEMDAVLYFQSEFMPCAPEIPRRGIYIVAPNGERIGTSTAWWDYDGQRRIPIVHWVAVKPGFQGLGLGKAIIAETLRLMCAVDGDVTFYLRTQTASHKAVGLYEQAGFYLVGEKGILGCENERFDEAIALLQSLKK
jgi:GNAT superfamily N-acetyltransferase